MWIEGRCPRCLPYTPKARKKEQLPRCTRGRAAAGRIDITGQQFGRLTVIGFAFTRRKAFWNCRCECGTACTVNGTHLRTGRVKSCGCYRRDIAPDLGRKSAAVRRRNALSTGISQNTDNKHGAKLSREQVLSIRLEYSKGGITHDDLAAKYGVSDTAINALLRQETWRDVGGPLARTKNKVTANDVRAIRDEYAKGGITHAQLGQRYGLAPSSVTVIINRKNWRHIQ